MFISCKAVLKMCPELFSMKNIDMLQGLTGIMDILLILSIQYVEMLARANLLIPNHH